MEQEENDLLKRGVELAEENNVMLRSIKRSMRIASAMRAIYWIFIIGSAIGAYYLVQPYINQLLDVYGGAKSTYENIKNFGQ